MSQKWNRNPFRISTFLSSAGSLTISWSSGYRGSNEYKISQRWRERALVEMNVLIIGK